MESLNGQRRALEDEVSRLYNEHGKLLAEAEVYSPWLYCEDTTNLFPGVDNLYRICVCSSI